jgi:hypothetical protein
MATKDKPATELTEGVIFPRENTLGSAGLVSIGGCNKRSGSGLAIAERGTPTKPKGGTTGMNPLKGNDIAYNLTLLPLTLNRRKGFLAGDLP